MQVRVEVRSKAGREEVLREQSAMGSAEACLVPCDLRRGVYHDNTLPSTATDTQSICQTV